MGFVGCSVMMKHSFYQRLSEPNKGMLFIFVYFDDHISIMFVTAPSDSFSEHNISFFLTIYLPVLIVYSFPPSPFS